MARPGILRIVRLLAGLALALLALPLAAAQANLPIQAQVTGFMDDPGHPLQPGANETVEMTVNYQAGPASLPGPQPDNNDPTSSGPMLTHITYRAKQVPTWVENLTFDPPEVYANDTPGMQQEPHHVHVILRIAKNAPAGNHQNLSVDLIADPNGPTPGATGTTSEIALRPGAVPKVNVTKDAQGQAILKGGSWQPVRFHVTNVGNGQITARLNVTVRPQDSIVDFPATLTLDPGQTLPVDVMLRLPWTYGESGALELEATPLGAGDEEGKPAHADVDIAGQSAVPALEPLVAVAAVGMLALLRRRS